MLTTRPTPPPIAFNVWTATFVQCLLSGNCGVSMTRNNLSEHLSWLRISKSSVPPPGLPVLPVVDSPVHSSAHESEFEVLATTQEERPRGGVDAFETAPRPFSSQPSIESARLALPAHAPSQGDGPAKFQPMARLQSGPKSATKSRLLSHIPPLQLPSPAPTVNRNDRPSFGDSYNAQFRTQVTSESSIHRLSTHLCSQILT